MGNNKVAGHLENRTMNALWQPEANLLRRGRMDIQIVHSRLSGPL